jgi:hypothetical protein
MFTWNWGNWAYWQELEIDPSAVISILKQQNDYGWGFDEFAEMVGFCLASH